MRTEVVRVEVGRLLAQVPFRPFALNMENGDRIVIEHPENIAFDPGADGSAGSPDFYVISQSLRVYGGRHQRGGGRHGGRARLTRSLGYPKRTAHAHPSRNWRVSRTLLRSIPRQVFAGFFGPQDLRDVLHLGVEHAQLAADGEELHAFVGAP